MKVLSFLLLLTTTFCQAQPQESQREIDFTTEQVAEDIEFLKSELDRFHSGLHRYTAKEKLDQYFQEAAVASDGLGAEEMYARVTFLLSQIKCGHTRTRMTDQIREKHLGENRFIPFHIHVLGSDAFVSGSATEEIPKGAQLSKINGVTWKEVEAQIFNHLPSDGMIETGKRRMIGDLFPYYYQLYVDGSEEDIEVEWVSVDGSIKTTLVERIGNEKLENVSAEDDDTVDLSLKHFDKYSYLRISTFDYGGINDAGFNYPKFLKKSFKDLKSQGTENLILDLRGNGGGSDNYGALLVSYFLSKEFGYFDNIQVTSNYSGYGDIVERDGKYYVTKHKGLDRWDPHEDVFNGKLYVLIDGWSFSTCADVATVLHHHDRAVFIGEETGGGYDGNTSGNSKLIKLPNSGIPINVPMWMYTTANVGHEYPGRGVIPDHEVVPTFEEYALEEDAVMKKALELIGI
ncbi:MAG: S41 family peptidase [bacterium]|nr:S41 family peptidase [bacterium]